VRARVQARAGLRERTCARARACVHVCVCAWVCEWVGVRLWVCAGGRIGGQGGVGGWLKADRLCKAGFFCCFRELLLSCTALVGFFYACGGSDGCGRAQDSSADGCHLMVSHLRI
jgi:hypothetical protein